MPFEDGLKQTQRCEAGAQLGQYTILEELGHGGMGEVYKARDTRLKRLVAIKVVKSSMDPDAPERFRLIQEARAVAALNHPNIVQVFGLETYGGQDCIVMEFVQGTTLQKILTSKQLSASEAVSYSAQMASALAAAHAANIVHRDIKPANVIVTAAGIVKVLDFGLAKLERVNPEPDAATLSASPQTSAGMILGTAAYMSPEQALGKPADPRSDVFSLGVVMYEMFTGTQPFQSDSIIGSLASVIGHQPPPVRQLRPDTPLAIEDIVCRCMEKAPESRYSSGAELNRELSGLQKSSLRAASRVPVLAVAVILLAVIGAAWWFYLHYSSARWVRNNALPRIQRLIAHDDYFGAFDLVREAARKLPDDPQVKQYLQEASLNVSLNTEPSGATVSYRDYGNSSMPWRRAGQTPFRDISLPQTQIVLRIEKEGFAPYELAALTGLLNDQPIRLLRPGERPNRMVPVPASAAWMPTTGMALQDYLIDQFEVTNHEFQQFVDAGGYAKREYWREPFRSDGRDRSFDEAMAIFRDRTGRPGPSGWELGSFPKERGDYPVSGVSWFEAAAYCQFAGKSLPTIHHWRKAAGFKARPTRF